jgi:hypothetical protein
VAIVCGTSWAQEAVPLETWTSTGLPEGAWVEPFDTLAIADERLQPLPKVETEVVGDGSHEPVVRAVTYQPAALPEEGAEEFPHGEVPPGDPLEDDMEDASTDGGAEGAVTAGGAAAGGGQQNQEQTFGPRPENNTLQFLRRDSVLIGAGKCQFDYGVNYTLFEDDLPAAQVDGSGNIVGVTEATVRQRLIYSPFGYRYGLSERWQFNAYLPVGWANTQFSVPGTSTNQSTGGIGDFTAGLSWQMCKGDHCYAPEVIGSFGFTAPTGDFNAPLFGLVPGSALGQGFWALNGNLLFVNRYDPIIAFYGVGYRHLFERSLSGSPFQPGEQISYQFGVGFAVNDRVTLSTTFFGYYITNSQINGQTLEGSNLEPMSLRFAATVTRKKRIIEPFAAVGLTESAPAAYMGIIFTKY